MERLQIPLHKKIPISLMPRSSSSSLILFGYSFLPESVEQEGRERESLLSVATDGSVSLIAGYKSKQSIRNNIGINGGDDDEDLIEDALHLTGTMSKQSEADYVMKIPHGVETNVELLPLAGAIAGLKRDRRNEFSRVDDKLSKAARTSLKEKQRAISQSRRRKLGEKKEEKTSTDDDAAKNTTEPAV